MNKKLTPLEALKILYPNTTYEPYYTRNEKRNACKIIETALKRLDTIDKFGVATGTLTTEEAIKEVEEYISNKNKLKALEIIKEKEVNIEFWFSFNVGVMTYKSYTKLNKKLVITSISKKELTKEEFDLLKEFF